MTDSTYNGWTNYATWRVNLEICDDLCNSYHADRTTFDDISSLADRLEEDADQIVSGYETIPEGFALDYARSFLSDVNWYEIAEHWTDELIEEEEEDSDAA